MHAIEKDAEQPRFTVGAAREFIEGFPGLQERFLKGILGAGAVSGHAQRNTEQIVHMRKGLRLEIGFPHLRPQPLIPSGRRHRLSHPRLHRSRNPHSDNEMTDRSVFVPAPVHYP